VRYGLAYNGFYSINELLEIARAADGTAVEGIWLAEHLGYRDAFVPAAAILAATQHLKVFPTAVSPYGRNAMLTAMQTASLAEMAPGRVVLGLGVGSPMAYQESGMSQAQPLVSVREYLQLIKALWSGERVMHEGRQFHMHNATFHVPVSPAPAIQLAAMRDQMLALAGEATDGVVISAGLAPEAIRLALQKTRRAADESGRPAGAVAGVGFVIASLAASDAEAVAAARHHLAYMLRNPFVAEQLRLTGTDLDATALAEAASRRDWDTAAQLIRDEIVDRCTLAGSLSTCRTKVARYTETGLDVLVLLPEDGAKGGWAALELIQSL
jgi:5,10-methylenetetrahydromethanopterin reductase